MDSKTLSALKGQARKDLLSFCVYTDKFFEVNKHHVTIAEELQAFMEGKTKRLILQTPPRSGKSRLVGEAIAWSMGAMNRRDVIYAGHSINLLEGFSRNIRGRVESMEFRSLFPNVKIKEGNAAINDWATTNDNRLMIYGVGGGITGKGWNCIVKGEKVLTDSWLLDILEVVETPTVFRVASYNHSTNAIEFQKAVNSKRSKSGNVYELRTVWGNTLKATGEHKVFVVWRGYTEMERLKEGERIIIHDGQRRMEPRDGLHELPQETPFFKIDTVSSVTRIEGEYDVFDIEVEWNHNFFASGILVHNCLIIDDPYATREDAESDTIRKKVYDWYNSTFYSRRHDHEAGICLIMQRWREDDLVGEVLGLEEWKVVKIPALDENGQSFWHSRFPPEELEKIRKQIGPYFFESQYQQEPVSLSAWDFKREMFTYCDNLEIEQRLPRMDVVTFLDPAISQKQEADFTAIVTVGFDPTNNYAYLLEAKQLKETPDNVISELFHTVGKYRNAGKSYRAGIETVQYQKMLAMEIRNQMRIRDKFFNLEDVSPQGEKEARIRSMLQPRYSSRSIVHPKNLPNLEALELELLKFPNAKHDDLIDALASALALRKANGTNQGSGLVTVDYGLSAFLD